MHRTIFFLRPSRLKVTVELLFINVKEHELQQTSRDLVAHNMHRGIDFLFQWERCGRTTVRFNPFNRWSDFYYLCYALAYNLFTEYLLYCIVTFYGKGREWKYEMLQGSFVERKSMFRILWGLWSRVYYCIIKLYYNKENIIIRYWKGIE